MNIYFAGSIRGGRQDVCLYGTIIHAIQQRGHTVLTEHIGNPDYVSSAPDDVIYRTDTDWILSSDCVIAECTQPSLGVGYELAFAEAHEKPVYILYNAKAHLSAMLAGNPAFHLYPYHTSEELESLLDHILSRYSV